MEGGESLKNFFLIFSQIREEFTSRKSGHKTENKMRALKVSKMAEMKEGEITRNSSESGFINLIVINSNCNKFINPNLQIY